MKKKKTKGQILSFPLVIRNEANPKIKRTLWYAKKMSNKYLRKFYQRDILEHLSISKVEMVITPEFMITAPVLAEIIRYTAERQPLEAGGALLGKLTAGQVEISACIPAPDAISSETAIIFTPQAWVGIDAVHRRCYPELLPCGWFHSHPGLGIFLSATDYHSHYDHHRCYYQLALVLDPLRQQLAFFGWNGGYLTSVAVAVRGELPRWEAPQQPNTSEEN